MRLIRQHWDARAADFDDDPEHGLHSDEQRRAWLHLLERLSGHSSKRVLDVGCGTGVLTILLAQLGHDVTGVDLAPRMLARARQKAECAGVAVSLRLEDAVKLSDPDASYDLVVARHVMWTLPDPQGVIRELQRVLREHGRLAIIESLWSPQRPEHDPLRMRRRLRRIKGRARQILYYGTRPRHWRRLLKELPENRYERDHVALPFYGGPTPSELANLMNAERMQDIDVTPLMDSTLWGEQPQFLYYLITALRTGKETSKGLEVPQRVSPTVSEHVGSGQVAVQVVGSEQ